MSSFCNLARSYHLLETVAFGPVLNRARLAWIDHLATVDPILLLGDGDGRSLCAILELNRGANITSIDSSPTMIEQARQRIRRVHPHAMNRVSWRCQDIRETRLPRNQYRAVVTQFFFDCFRQDEVIDIHGNISQSLKVDGRWIWSDFVVPNDPLRAFLARSYLGLLYRFFRWQTDISAHHLPAVPPLFAKSGLRPAETQRFLFGTIESSVWVHADL